MPEVSRFSGIVVKISTTITTLPTFHAEYGEHEALVNINTCHSRWQPSRSCPRPRGRVGITSLAGIATGLGQNQTASATGKNRVSALNACDMRAEYDFDDSKAVRGKYYRRLLKEDANVVILDPDVAKAFRSSAAVNEALRSFLRMSEATRRLTSRSVVGRRAPAGL